MSDYIFFTEEKTYTDILDSFENAVCTIQSESEIEGFLKRILLIYPNRKLYTEGDYKSYIAWKEKNTERLRKACTNIYFNYQKEQAIKQIREITTKAVIEHQLKELGYPYHLEYQKYRIKVSLLSGTDHIIDFYIKYRDLNRTEVTDELNERIKVMVEYIKMFGPTISIRKIRSQLERGWEFPDKWI